jgi:hypothetical protein
MSLRSPDLTLSASLFTDSAVYGWKRGDKYLYIGKALCLIKRWANHHAISLRDMGPTDTIDIWFCDTRIIDHLEKELIREYQPSLNKQLLREVPISKESREERRIKKRKEKRGRREKFKKFLRILSRGEEKERKREEERKQIKKKEIMKMLGY